MWPFHVSDSRFSDTGRLMYRHVCPEPGGKQGVLNTGFVRFPGDHLHIQLPPTMLLKLLYITRLGRYLCRKPPTNFSEEAKMEGVSSHVDHVTGRHVRGQQVLTLGLATEEAFLPLDSPIYIRQVKARALINPPKMAGVWLASVTVRRPARVNRKWPPVCRLEVLICCCYPRQQIKTSYPAKWLDQHVCFHRCRHVPSSHSHELPVFGRIGYVKQ